MTLKEASGRFGISIEKLNYYEENGLLMKETSMNGMSDYTEDELRKVGIIHALLNAGMSMDELQKYLQIIRGKGSNKEEQIRILRKQRYKLLDEIHEKQQTLDEIDYMIREIQMEGVKK